MNFSKSFDENRGPLSDTTVTGRPCVAKMVLSLSIFCEVEVEFTTKTSGHFEKASIATSITHLFHYGQHVISPKDSGVQAMGVLVQLVD